jgi:hypothetical protein
MPSWKKPTPDQVETVVAQLGQAEHLRYFFDHLNNPEWIHRLSQKHFFEHPPQPIDDQEQGTTLYLLWPQSRYLARMAALGPEPARAVLAEIVKIPSTANFRIHEDFADAALAMPPNLAAEWARREAEWIRAQIRIPFMNLALKLGSLVSHLATADTRQQAVALNLAGSLLEILPDPGVRGKQATALGDMFFPEPRARCDAWEYQQVLTKNVPDLVRASGQRALDLLCGLLQRAIELSRRESDAEKAADYSYIWRPELDRGKSTNNDIKSMLVSAVRDALEYLAGEEPTILPELVRQLEERSWLIFHRLSLHILRKYADKVPQLVDDRLVRPEEFDDPHFKREYSLLLRECFATLTQANQNKILEWIAAGPGQGRAEEWFRFVGQDATAENVRKFEDRWRWEKLSPIGDRLSGTWGERWEKLVAEFRQPEDQDYISTRTRFWQGPTPPKTAKELGSMDPRELVSYLREWKWDGSPEGPSPEGLARELATAIAANPAKFASEAKLLATVEEPTYIRGFISGFGQAAKEGKEFSWEPVLILAKWALSEDHCVEQRPKSVFEIDPDWTFARIEVARLLSDTLESDKAAPPFELRQLVWDVLEPLTRDSSPSPEEERSSLDPGTLSINCTRGVAMHAAMRYGLWVRRSGEKLPAGKERAARGFDEMPELREVLVEHLDPAKDPSPAIRSVYGQWFPWLVYLDARWARDQIPRIFPSEESLKQYLAAAWDTYVVFCNPYDNVLPLLREQYSRAIDRIGSREESKQRLGDPDERLGQHLVIFYGRGKLPLDGEDSLMRRFYATANGNLRGAVNDFAGRSLEGGRGLPSEVIERFKQFWSWRVSVVTGEGDQGASANELSGFGTWFNSGAFDDEWGVTQLLEVLRAAQKVNLDMFVVERLATLAEKFPHQAVECLDHLIEGDKEGWAVQAWHDHARSILVTALRVGDAEARQSAIDVVNRLGQRGYFEFRDLLR